MITFDDLEVGELYELPPSKYLGIYLGKEYKWSNVVLANVAYYKFLVNGKIEKLSDATMVVHTLERTRKIK